MGCGNFFGDNDCWTWVIIIGIILLILCCCCDGKKC